MAMMTASQGRFCVATRLARGTARGDQDEFAGADAHRVRRHDMAAGFLAFGVHVS